MARGRRQAQRVFVAQPLAHGVTIACDPGQRNYLLNVLRLTDGDAVHVFNGVDGEWHAVLRTPSRKVCALEPVEQRRAQTDGPELTLAFAPLKRDRLDYLVQKATELGVRAICPVMTERVQTQRLKLDRLEANVIEAAEQCGVLRIPSVASPVAFDDFLAARGDDDDDDGAGDGGEVAQAARTGGAVEASITAQTVASGRRSLVFCDEAAEVANPIAALSSLVLDRKSVV